MTTSALNIVKPDTSPSLATLIDARERVRAMLADSRQQALGEHRAKIEQLLVELPRLTDPEVISKRVKDINLLSAKYDEHRSNLESLDGEITFIIDALEKTDPKAYLAAIKQRAERLLPAAEEYTALQKKIAYLQSEAPESEPVTSGAKPPVAKAKAT